MASTRLCCFVSCLEPKLQRLEHMLFPFVRMESPQAQIHPHLSLHMLCFRVHRRSSLRRSVAGRSNKGAPSPSRPAPAARDTGVQGTRVELLSLCSQSERRGYLLFGERTWCLIHPVGAGTGKSRGSDGKAVFHGAFLRPGLKPRPLTLTARFTWLSWVTGAAAKGRLEVMDGLLKNLPLPALRRAKSDDYKSPHLPAMMLYVYTIPPGIRCSSSL